MISTNTYFRVYLPQGVSLLSFAYASFVTFHLYARKNENMHVMNVQIINFLLNYL
jgi:hypothetical protein